MAKRIHTPADPVATAREIARAEVARRWPELAEIEPTVTLRARYLPAPAELERVGAAVPLPLPLATPAGAEYTFTFAGHTHTPDGYTLPRIARVTVDAQRRVVKATTSK